MYEVKERKRVSTCLFAAQIAALIGPALRVWVRRPRSPFGSPRSIYSGPCRCDASARHKPDSKRLPTMQRMKL